MNIFNIVPKDFFNPLASQNKIIYFDCIKIIYDLTINEHAYSVEKKLVVEDLKDYLANRRIEDEDNNILIDPQSKASEIIRSLRRYGWIDEDYVGSVLKISIPDYAQTFFESMLKIIREDEIEYKTSIHNIYSIIKNQDNFREPYSLVAKNINSIMQELIKSLKKLNTNIKKYIEKIVSQKTPKEVLEMLSRFKDEIMSKAFKRVKNDGNINAFKVEILQRIEEIITDRYLEFAINDCLNHESNIETAAQAKEKVKDIIYDVKQAFEVYDSIMANVDERYNSFLKSTAERCEFLLSTDDNLKGKINLILSNIIKINEKNDNIELLYDTIISNSVNIYPQQILGNESLYVPRTKSKELEIAELGEVQLLSEDDRNKLIEQARIRQSLKFTLDNINTYIKNQIKENGRVMMSDLPCDDIRDEIRAIYIYLYGNNYSACYEINVSDRKVQYGTLVFNDYEIVRGEK